MTEQQSFLIEGVVGDMALWVMQEREVTLDSALSLIYNSTTFEKLQNPATGLYSESSAYTYELLKSELNNGKFIQIDY